MNQNAKRRHQMGHPEAEPQVAAPAPAPVLPQAEGAFAFTVTSEEARQRLDRFLAGAVETAGRALSRNRLRSLIEEGHVAVGGAMVTDPGAKTRAGQEIALDVPPPLPAEPSGEAIPLDVVFEDAHLIVIEKPAGLVVHPAAGHESGTLVNALIAHCGASLSGIGGVRRPGIVHRLDKDTSGLLVVAKTDAAHQGLAALFADHGRTLSLTREYLALVFGTPERLQGTVEASLARHPHHREKQTVVHGDRGRAAITHWHTEEVFGPEKARSAALLRCSLETGRTHQIRVHMAHIGHPVMGDPVYGTGFRTKASRLTPAARAALEALGRQALHAAVLGFTHPVTGEELLFESEPPPDMAALIAALRED